MLDFAYLTSLKKNYIGWPQQPPTEKVLKFNMIFHDSTHFAMRYPVAVHAISSASIIRTVFLPNKLSGLNKFLTVNKLLLSSYIDKNVQYHKPT